MPHVALDARNPQWGIALDTTERFGDGVALDAVAHYRAGGMGFDIVELLRHAARASAGCAHQSHLCVTRGRGDVPSLRQAGTAVGGAGRIDRGRLHHGVDGIPISFSRCQGLDREHECPFRTHISVRLCVEGVALTVRADNTQRIE